MANDIWASLGFNGNPYQATPLRPTREDFELFIGREEAGIEFRTQVESETGCVTVISGDVGVGKTSLFNIQQYLLFSGTGGWGPRLLPALELTPLDGQDSPAILARRVTHNAVRSIEVLCRDNGYKLPKQISKIKKWLSHQGNAAGFDFGFSLLGTGGNLALSFEVPPASEASLENWRDILGVIAAESRDTLNYDGFFVALDNAENVDSEHLADLLMSFRDTLFVTVGVWWVVIGQSGLYGMIDSLDRRISQRIQGTGLEIAPLSADDLHAAVERRIIRFRAREDAVSPISRDLHDRLYEASRGEIRFVLKTSDALVRRVVANLRVRASGLARRTTSEGEAIDYQEAFARFLRMQLSGGRFPDGIVEFELRHLTHRAIHDLRLRRKELQVLQRIGTSEARASDHRKFGIKTMRDFSGNYLTKLFRASLLHRRQAGRAVYYSLRGYAALAHQFEIFDRLIEDA